MSYLSKCDVAEKAVVNQEVEEWVKELRDLQPTKQNYDKIVVIFQQTFNDRCVLRQKNYTGAEIIKKYPKFMDYSGRLVSNF